VAVLMLIFHVVALAGLIPMRLGKPAAALVWGVLSAGFLVVILLAVAIFSAEWTCDNEFIPKIVLSESFDYNYGFTFACLGYLSALLIFFVNLFAVSVTDGTPAGPKSIAIVPTLLKVLGSVTVCLAVGAGLGLAIAGANKEFDSTKVDPNVNPCEGQKPYNLGPGDGYFHNTACEVDNIIQTLEQAGANVTAGYRGGMDAGTRVPITKRYPDTDLCPVNVHWHLGAEHLSVGQFDEHGSGPPIVNSSSSSSSSSSGRRLAGADDAIRLGHRCHHYTTADVKFTNEYNWQHCVNMQVGETYEIHWPHSAAGSCGTKWQMQSPFYDGVFCNDGIITVAPLNTYEKIGVQSQTFTVVNDEAYYYADLFKGMMVDDTHGQDMAKYTGSTTGTSRDNQMCSRYTPITWQVDRRCHMISASSFDKLCADMKMNADDMSTDLYPHGSRVTVATHLTANNQQSRIR